MFLIHLLRSGLNKRATSRGTEILRAKYFAEIDHFTWCPADLGISVIEKQSQIPGSFEQSICCLAFTLPNLFKLILFHMDLLTFQRIWITQQRSQSTFWLKPFINDMICCARWHPIVTPLMKNHGALLCTCTTCRRRLQGMTLMKMHQFRCWTWNLDATTTMPFWPQKFQY